MTATQFILDDLIEQLRRDPGRANDHIVLDLQQNHSLSPATARSMLKRARYALGRETTRWCTARRRDPKPLPGETIGALDNAVRILENLDAE